MLYSTKENHGNYSITSYIKRGVELCSPKELLSYQRDYLPEIGWCRKMFLYLDYYCCLIKYGATVCDYFEYQFWKKRSCERKEYATKRKAQKIQNFFNVGDKEIVIDKKIFNKRFADFRSVKNFYFDESSEDEFIAFVKDCSHNVIAKPYMGASGMGIFKPDVSTEEKARKVYKDLKANGEYFIEETFVQTGILGLVNPSSVNTIRIYTLHDGNEVHLMDAFVRFGGSTECVDNIHAGGMVCEIDAKTGDVVGKGYNLMGKETCYHPISGMLLPGIKIPQWSEVVSSIMKAAELIPEIGYLGWDVAVSDDKVCIIEANEVGNLDLVQCGSQNGCLKRYQAVVETTKRNRSIIYLTSSSNRK